MAVVQADIGGAGPLNPLEELRDDGARGDGAGDTQRGGDVDGSSHRGRGRGGNGHAGKAGHVGQGQPAHMHRVAQLGAKGDPTIHTPQNPSPAGACGHKLARLGPAITVAGRLSVLCALSPTVARCLLRPPVAAARTCAARPCPSLLARAPTHDTQFHHVGASIRGCTERVPDRSAHRTVAGGCGALSGTNLAFTPRGCPWSVSSEIRTVAEGVETTTQLEYVGSLGIHACQGFLFSRPVPAADVLDAVRLHSGATQTPLRLPEPAGAPARDR